MARGFGAREAFTVQARTYPKVWRDGVVADIKKAAANESDISMEEARLRATAKESKSFLGNMTAAQLYPSLVPGAVDKAIEAVEMIYKTLKEELPGHTVGFFSSGKPTLLEEKDKDGDTKYSLSLQFKSPSGKYDQRTFLIGYGLADGTPEEQRDARELAEAVEQLVLENGEDREEIIGGKRQSIDARRRKED